VCVCVYTAQYLGGGVEMGRGERSDIDAPSGVLSLDSHKCAD